MGRLGLAGKPTQPRPAARLGDLAAAPALAWVADTGEVEEGRGDVHHRGEGMADRALPA